MNTYQNSHSHDEKMRILIACFSYSGNTLKVAYALQKVLSAEFTQIEPVEDKWFLFKVWNSLRGNLVPIKPCITDLKDYDALIICSPVWAGRTPAAVNEYLSLLKNARDKKFGVLITAGGKRNQKTAVYIREYLTQQDMNFLGQTRILADEVKNESFNEKIELFSKKFQIK